jgi:hypothetical protein
MLKLLVLHKRRFCFDKTVSPKPVLHFTFKMKLITLLSIIVALSACATKPYLVGSANDRKSPARVPGEDAVEALAKKEKAQAEADGAAAAAPSYYSK